MFLFVVKPSIISSYIPVHKSPSRLGDSRPTALDIIKDERLEGQLTKEVFLITGCSSEIGIETARALATADATLCLTARDIKKGGAALEGVLTPARLQLLKLDLNSLASVRSCAQELLSKSKTLNVLINNAGVTACPEGRTADGSKRNSAPTISRISCSSSC